MQDGTAESLVLASAILFHFREQAYIGSCETDLVLETLRWGVVIGRGVSTATVATAESGASLLKNCKSSSQHMLTAGVENEPRRL